MNIPNVISRRQVLVAGASLAALAAAAPAAAARLVATPAQSEGPFYPLTLPLDRDNDLVQVAGQPRLAKGTITHLFGRVLDVDGRPVGGARVEIWQCDADGHYHHPGDRRGPADPAFQGFGQTVTAADGAYRFRTIRPVPYPGRTPHIHVKVAARNAPELTTQMYVAGEPGNERDFLLRSIRDPAARARVIVPLEPAVGLEPGALQANFDIVSRATPERRGFGGLPPRRDADGGPKRRRRPHRAAADGFVAGCGMVRLPSPGCCPGAESPTACPRR